MSPENLKSCCIFVFLHPFSHQQSAAVPSLAVDLIKPVYYWNAFKFFETANAWCLSGNGEWAGMLSCIFLLFLDGKGFSFAVRWDEGDGNIYLCLVASRPCLSWWRRGQQLLEQVWGLPLQLFGDAPMLKTSLLPRRGVTLVPGWWALLKTGRLGCRESVCAFPPRTHTSEIYVLANCVSVFKWPSLAGRVNHCQPSRNRSAGAKALERGTAWLKCAWAWGVPEEQAAWAGWENWWESRKTALSFYVIDLEGKETNGLFWCLYVLNTS